MLSACIGVHMQDLFERCTSHEVEARPTFHEVGWGCSRGLHRGPVMLR